MASLFAQIILLTLSIASVVGKQCSTDEFNYEYTQCDASGERWRVALPKNHQTTCDNIVPPKTVNCSFTCPPGHHLDMASQGCRICPSGTYSLGNATRYEEFTSLPQGFSVENFADDTQQIFGTTSSPSATSCPKGVGWNVNNGEIRYQPTLCVSRLSISLHLVKDGYVEIYFQMPKNRFGLITDLVIKNEQCESNRASSIFSHRKQTDEEVATNNEWRTKRFSVRRGQNLLIWTVTSNNELTSISDIIRLARIDVVGLGFTPTCTACPPGTYSGAGSSYCSSCGANSFSPKGSSNCQTCQINEYSESVEPSHLEKQRHEALHDYILGLNVLRRIIYISAEIRPDSLDKGPKSGKCHQKPLCRNFDYYPVYGSCSANKTIMTFRRVKPLVCQINAPTSIQTPQNQIENCRNCDPGMKRSSITGACEFCAANEYSPTGKECLKCPNQTIPNHGLFYSNFEQMPSVLSTSCEFMTSDDTENCNSDSWLPMGNRIETAPTRSKGIALELLMNLTDGFYDPLYDSSSNDPISHLSIDFETQCSDESCQFYIVLSNYESGQTKSGFQFVGAFSGTQQRTKFEYAIEHSGPQRFVFAFMRSGAATGQDNINDRAAIYSLNITNVGNQSKKQTIGGADSCRQCPITDNKGDCRPCPQGHYIELLTSKCVKCPEGTALNKSSNRIGPESCLKCPDHMGSESREDCSFSGKLTLLSKDDNKKMNFDLSPLMNTTLQANGLKIFPREGSAYYRTYNVSLFNKPVRCQDSLENALFDSAGLDRNRNSANVNAKFCRSTAMPLSQLSPINHTNVKTAFISSYVISTKLELITQERTFHGFHLTDEQLEYESLSAEKRPIDVHFFYEPGPKKAGTCVNGTLGIVTVRCEPLAVKEQVRLSHSCPDGTCDGCLFHVIVETSYGCPICDSDDFDEIRGECENGYQTIHSIPSKHCVLSGVQTKERTETCSNFSSNIRLFFFLAASLISFLIIVIVIIYQKNKSLQYRYSRIVEGKEPDLNSCGLESDEDDEDTNQTKVFFNKKRNPTENGADRFKVTVGEKRSTKLSEKPLNEKELEDFLSDSSD